MQFKKVLTSLSMLLGSSTVLADDLSLAVSMVNQARQAQGIPPLAWNPDLAAYAQFWANQMGAGSQPFSHAPPSLRPQQGETIYVHQSTQCDVAFDTPLQTAMHMWLAEVSQYNGQPVTTGSEPWLHWSQCMWSQSTQIGCARAFSVSEPYKVFDVCRFLPEGNMIGQKPY
ncbi:Fc.00g065130.m01.CDS01 [Cosmosporella sp. VM-42]